MDIEYAPVALPEFGLPKEDTALPPSTFAERLSQLEERYVHSGFENLLVYGDREHFANLCYLTNYDPRFEEAILVLQPGKRPVLFVGNEGMPYAKASVPVPMEFVLYQTFSLLSQPRDSSRPLRELFASAGLTKGKRVGVVGWKYFTDEETGTGGSWIDIPAYLADTLRQMGCSLSNATDLLMHPVRGMRAVSDADQIAYFEAASSFSSQAVRSVVFGVRPGMSEFEGLELAHLNGWPTSMYPILLGGERTRLGLGSPSHRRFMMGDPVVTCVGLWGGNTCRAGFLAKDAGDLPTGVRDYLDRLVVPYFRSAVAWYETIGLGVTGGEVFEAVHRHVGDPFFRVGLNPGHLIHLDEWVSSPMARDSGDALKSGMTLQLDIIPATGTDYWTSNVEDGIALADEGLRHQIASRYPAAWDRIQRRRTFMRDQLGIALRPEVLPFSNIPCYLPPYWLSPDRALRRG